ncbi:zinc finger (CCCH type) protein, putative [Eimeria acervulina]|uniref:Zinc finger (CCCH type) protein, putative n=1 Tax=Eimeria acervulina TaxID=5801 RepID=U6GBX3_EIMAC|nr:zinc finger (CCCH type) protein, putative [Eimeria acervulina]CDI76848.1 zinc finger (CCCH type) protein, putative [Eimeria acervulina]
MDYPMIAAIANQQDRRLPVFIPRLVDYPPIYCPAPQYLPQQIYRAPPKAPVNRLINTKMCSRYLSKGYCRKRDCTFAHSVEELRPTPDLRCTKWCRFVFFGLECNDARCPYAHSQDELQPQPPEYKTTLCRFAKRGKCLNGDNCRFLHPHEVTAPAYRHHDKLRVPRLSNPSVEEESGVQAAEEEAATLPTPETEPTQEEICQTAAPPTTPAAAAPATPSCPETPRVVNRTRPLLCSPCVVAGETPCAEETEEEYEGSCASTTSPGRKARKATTLVPNTLSRDSTRDELHGSVERIMTAAGTLGLADDPN